MLILSSHQFLRLLGVPFSCLFSHRHVVHISCLSNVKNTSYPIEISLFNKDDRQYTAKNKFYEASNHVIYTVFYARCLLGPNVARKQPQSLFFP